MLHRSLSPLNGRQITNGRFFGTLVTPLTSQIMQMCSRIVTIWWNSSSLWGICFPYRHHLTGCYVVQEQMFWTSDIKMFSVFTIAVQHIKVTRFYWVLLWSWLSQFFTVERWVVLRCLSSDNVVRAVSWNGVFGMRMLSPAGVNDSGQSQLSLSLTLWAVSRTLTLTKVWSIKVKNKFFVTANVVGLKL